jgi:Flp pilus assembly protein TadG
MRTLLRLLKKTRGQAAVEFALVGVIFFMLVMGLIEVGRAVWHYNALSHAVREGARYAMVHGSEDTDPSGPGSSYYSAPDQDSQVTQTVEDFASGLDVSNLTVSSEWLSGSNIPGTKVQVTGEYEFEPIFGFAGMVSFTMTSSTTMEITH